MHKSAFTRRPNSIVVQNVLENVAKVRPEAVSHLNFPSSMRIFMDPHY